MHIRKAAPSDYEAIWSIWMQDHVIQWMSFPWQTQKEFAAHYARMEKASDIYVLIDKVNEQEKVVAVRRIKFGKNHSKHTAEYCSMGVDKDCLGKGYATFFYEEFEKIARQANIKRIQLTQSGGNEAAFHIADKHSFSQEAVFPDWLERSHQEGHYYLIERYIYRFLDKELEKTASELPSLQYKEIFPLVHDTQEHNDVTVKRQNNKFICYAQNKPILTVDVDPDDSVIKHIGFLSITLHAPYSQAQAEKGLRNVLTQILKEGRVKKLELFTAEPETADLCKQLGFFVRGEKIASYYDNGQYKNELGVEYSFFTITDANSLLTAKVSHKEKKETIEEALTHCSNSIKTLIDDGICDMLGARYLENLVYQMVRDELGPNNIFSLSDKRWKALLSQTPMSLHKDLLQLFNRLQTATSAFYNPNSGISSLTLLAETPPPRLDKKNS